MGNLDIELNMGVTALLKEIRLQTTCPGEHQNGLDDLTALPIY